MPNFSLEYQRYQDLIDILRFQRSTKSWKAEDDRQILEKLVILEENMSEAEQDILREEGWRSWPDLYQAKMKETKGNEDI